jgi:two-component system sensor histidine kinase ArlS
MKIQNKLILIFSCLFGLILILFIEIVYHSYSKQVHDGYFERLHLQAAVKVDLIDGGTVDKDILHLIYENTPTSMEPFVTIYTEEGKLVYRDKSVIPLTKLMEFIKFIKRDGQYESWYGKLQLYGMLIDGEKGRYVAIALGYDARGLSQLKSLRDLLAISFLFAMLFIILTVRLFTRQAFRPVSRMTDKVSDIADSHSMNIRLDEGNRKDELAHLAITFNNMLSRLQAAFNAQKQLVYDMSHELRTPLSAIVTELELVKESAKTKEDYEESVDKVLGDSHRLVTLSNDLLDMAKANYEPSEIATHIVRLDEIILEACLREQKKEPNYKVQIVFDKEEIYDDRLVSLHGNEYLLGVAFSNLMDNGCKYSPDKRCEVHISYEENKVIVLVEDHGIGITSSDVRSIFNPFFRGENKNFASGNGIGLSLAKRIIDIHGGDISVESVPGHTVFTISLPNLMHS